MANANDIQAGAAYVVLRRESLLSRICRAFRRDDAQRKAAAIERRVSQSIARCDARRAKIERRLRRQFRA